jgi:hypothetical protein
MDGIRQALVYFPAGERVQFHVVASEDAEDERTWPPRLLPRDCPGRVLFHRLDESCFLVGVVERDEAERIAPSMEAQSLGWCQDGLRNPRPPAPLVRQLQLGLY